jgi:very-short-patch-repair endonuclease
MERRKKLPNGYWNNLDNCLAEARKYQTNSEWQRFHPLSYRWACKNKWLEACSAHMATSRVPDGYWTLDRCKEVARKYKTKVEWRAGDGASFSAANRQKWISECCGHMETGGLWFGPASIAETLLSHDISYEAEYRFKANPEIARRPFDFYLPDFNLIIEFHGEQHLIGWGRSDLDAKSIQERDRFKRNWALVNGINFLEIKQWEVSSREEIERHVLSMLQEISTKQGVNLSIKKRKLSEPELKKVKAKLKWTLKACMEEAKKHAGIKEWQVSSAGSYNAAFAKGWLDQCCSHMVRKLFPRNHWTLERCIEDAKQYQTKAQWASAKRSGYTIASKNGWLEECTSHMISDMRKVGIQRVWTLEKCLELARSCSTRAEFKRASGSAYQRARVNGWLEECCAHMAKGD